MVHVNIVRTPAGDLIGFDAWGHAGYARKGNDIVCAAVSALTQTAVIALPRHANVTPKVTMDEDSGLLTCRLPAAMGERDAERARLILECMETGLTEIAREYPKFIRMREVKQP